MADANLDVMIRKLAKQQHKTLTAAVKKQRDHYAALATKAKDAETRQGYRQLAKDALAIGTATVKRLQTSADNAADSHARAMRQAADAAKAAAAKAPAKKAETRKSAKATGKSAAGKKART